MPSRRASSVASESFYSSKCSSDGNNHSSARPSAQHNIRHSTEMRSAGFG